MRRQLLPHFVPPSVKNLAQFVTFASQFWQLLNVINALLFNSYHESLIILALNSIKRLNAALILY